MQSLARSSSAGFPLYSPPPSPRGPACDYFSAFPIAPDIVHNTNDSGPIQINIYFYIIYIYIYIYTISPTVVVLARHLYIWYTRPSICNSPLSLCIGRIRFYIPNDKLATFGIQQRISQVDIIKQNHFGFWCCFILFNLITSQLEIDFFNLQPEFELLGYEIQIAHSWFFCGWINVAMLFISNPAERKCVVSESGGRNQWAAVLYHPTWRTSQPHPHFSPFFSIFFLCLSLVAENSLPTSLSLFLGEGGRRKGGWGEGEIERKREREAYLTEFSSCSLPIPSALCDKRIEVALEEDRWRCTWRREKGRNQGMTKNKLGTAENKTQRKKRKIDR